MKLKLFITAIILSTTAFTDSSYASEQSHDSNSPLLPSDNTWLLTETEPEFLVPLLKSLARKSQSQMSQDKKLRNTALFLKIALFDESPNPVNISFTFLTEDLESWKDFNDHLADSLADVIQEAERHNFTSEFNYDIFVNEIPPEGPPQLPINCLKTCAG